MATARNLDELEIVGYSDALKQNMLPAVVPPVFRFKADLQKALLPPFRISGAFVYEGAEVAMGEVEELRDANEITLIHSVFSAKPGFTLWLDQSFQPRYELNEDVRQQLHRIADHAIQTAEAALQAGDYRQAEEFAGVAISADSKRVEPLVIKAAIRRAQQNRAGERVMVRLAEPFLEERAFAALVDRYFPQCRPTPIRRMALLKPDLLKPAA